MHRLFVAIRPPSAIRAVLLDTMQGVRNVRWQEEDQLHLTLRFVGEVDRHRANDLAAELGTIRHPGFALALDGIGTFDRRGKGALWAGVKPHGDLQALHKKVDHACRRVGLAPEQRAYHPHVTLARFSHGGGPIDALVARSGGLASEPFKVDWFALFESELAPSGPLYSIVERYPLAAADRA